MISDSELLHRFAEKNDQAAFAEIVRRRVDLVYSVAVRQCGGDRALAQDVTQRVFADMGRKARTLAERPVLSGWLYRSAQFAASDVVRAERRRRVREQESLIMESAMSGEAPRDWDRLRPLLDEVLGELDDADRDAVALRFFEQRPFAEIGAALRLSEDAARKRVERALEKVRLTLANRGVTSTAIAVGVALEQQVSFAAPTHLTASIVSAGVSPAVIGWSAIKVIAVSGLIVGLGAGGWMIHRNSAPSAEHRTHISNTLDQARQTPGSVKVSSLGARTDQPTGHAPTEMAPAVPEPDQPPSSLAPAKAETLEISGQVHAPGRFPWTGKTTLKELIERAGGVTTLARTTAIRVARRDESGTVKIFAVADPGPEPFGLAPGDVVYVPEIIIGSKSGAGAPLASGNVRPRREVDPTNPGKRAAGSELVQLRLPDADLETTFSTLRLYTGRNVVRDASIAQLRASIRVTTGIVPKEDAIAQIEKALREQAHVVIEPTADGQLVAKRAPTP